MKALTRTARHFLSILLIGSSTQMVALSQHAGTDARLDRSAPSVYLSAERLDDENFLWLRFHNNTKWALNVRTEQGGGESVKRFTLEGGASVDGLADGVEVSPEYQVERPDVREGTGWFSCISVRSWVPPGHSFVFKIPRSQFSKMSRVYVEFTYEWEPDEAEATHRVYSRWVHDYAHPKQR